MISKIKRTIKWIPIIWKSEPWDHTFLLNMLRAKLWDMSHYFAQSEITTSSKRIHKQIQYTLYLIELYKSPELSPKLAPFRNLDFLDMLDFDADRFREPTREELTYFELHEKVQRDAWRRLWRHLEQYIENWWD